VNGLLGQTLAKLLDIKITIVSSYYKFFFSKIIVWYMKNQRIKLKLSWSSEQTLEFSYLG
jgi:hypothetical protein